MIIDLSFPPPPQYNQPPLPCSDLSPERLRALSRLDVFAAVAESLLGSIGAPAYSSVLPYVATSRGFVLHCFTASPFLAELAELLACGKTSLTADDHIDAPHVMLIDPRRFWGVLGPLRGDIVLFADGSASIVTAPLCMGCQHFIAVSLDTEVAPQIVLRTQWTSTIRWIIRLIDETPAALPDMASADVRESIESAVAADAEPDSKRKRKREITGL